MSLPPLRNPLTRLRAWTRHNQAKVQILAITVVAIGLIVIMMVTTLVALYLKLR
jgi:hypothetical protein